MKKILIIEDDEFVRDLYKRYLEKAGYEVAIAADGETGLAMAKKEKYDLILLDIMLPKKTGLDVLKELRESPDIGRNNPVFLLTNLGQEAIIAEAFKIGCQAFLLKAKLLPQDVVREVEKFLNKSQT